MPKDRTPQREAAYGAIDSERAYQKDKWGEKPHEIDAFALYVSDYAAQLARVCATSGDNTLKLDFMRKVGALAVACMEMHGAPAREGYAPK